MRRKQEFDNKMGRRIKTAREKASYTQEKLAELMDVSVQYLAKLEAGRVGISLPNFTKLCKVLGVSADYLLWGEREENDMSTIVDCIRYLPEKQYKLLENIIRSYMEAVQISGDTEKKV